MDLGVSKTMLKNVLIVFAALAVLKMVGKSVASVEKIRGMII